MYPEISTLLIGSQAPQPSVAMLASALLIVVIDLVLINYCLDDMSRRVTLMGGDRRFWTVAIILGGPLGQVAYWMYGRGEH